MQQQFFLARQPILDRKESLCAFELLFRSGHTVHAGVIDGVSASASVMPVERDRPKGLIP